MSVLNVYLDIDNNYLSLIKDSYKVVVILLVFQILVFFSNLSKNVMNTALSGNILNDEFITLVIFVLIGIASYYLIFERLLSFH
jgi:hypothetical protein